MSSDQERTLSGLQLAINMEIDGQKYYLEQSRLSQNEPGRQLFRSLSEEENLHRQKFETIYAALGQRQNWPKIDLALGRVRGIQTLFARAVDELGLKPTTLDTELDSVQKALDMETKSYDLYQSRSQQANSAVEREFYTALAGEEKSHYLILLDYREYLKDPASWFLGKEHHSLDGA